MTVDVVIPSASGLDGMLRRTLPSVCAAADAAGVDRGRIVLADDLPGRDHVRAYARELGVSWVDAPGRGAGPARNLGAERGGSGIICFVDDDVVLDEGALLAGIDTLRDPAVVAAVGGLRPPSGSPRWLEETYEWGTLTPASGLAAEGRLPFVSFATGLVVIRRSAFEHAGGFPDEPGIEDALFGLRLAASAGASARLERRHRLGGVHWYSPTWAAWLQRSWRSGARLREIRERVDGQVHAALLGANGLVDGSHALPKRLAGMFSPSVLLGLRRSPLQRRTAAAGAFARGYAGRTWVAPR